MASPSSSNTLEPQTVECLQPSHVHPRKNKPPEFVTVEARHLKALEKSPPLRWQAKQLLLMLFLVVLKLTFFLYYPTLNKKTCGRV